MSLKYYVFSKCLKKNGKMDTVKAVTDMCDGKILQKMNGGIYQNTSLQCVVAYWQIRGGGSKPPISSVMVAY